MYSLKTTLSVFLMIFVATTGILNAEDNPKMIELVLDASGSMNATLAGGERKITAAKRAVRELVTNLPTDLTLALRAYGHQSDKKKKDCKDTQLLVGFDKLATNKSKIDASLENLTARGYTPITYVLNLAFKDFPKDETKTSKTIILVSDGKETCEGDPCLTAQEIKESGKINLIVHTVGFGVNSVTKQQLECIASVTGGQYFSASNTNELVDMMKQAIETQVEEVKEQTGNGWLSIKGPELQGHKVTDASTGEEIGSIWKGKDTIELPAGIYNVEIGNTAWKSVNVKPGETTVLEPGWLSVKNTTISGNKVLEKETGELFGHVSRTDDTITILPGTYDVMFGDLAWTVTIEKGKTTELLPGTVTVKSATINGHDIYDQNGNEVGSVSATGNWMPLPPGEYMIEIGEQQIEFSLKENENKVFERK